MFGLPAEALEETLAETATPDAGRSGRSLRPRFHRQAGTRRALVRRYASQAPCFTPAGRTEG